MVVPGDVARVQTAEGDRTLRFGHRAAWQVEGTPLLYNARAETLSTKPAWREAAAERRCAVEVDGWYEGTTVLAGRAREEMWLAGIWWPNGFVLLTTAACAGPAGGAPPPACVRAAPRALGGPAAGLRHGRVAVRTSVPLGGAPAQAGSGACGGPGGVRSEGGEGRRQRPAGRRKGKRAWSYIRHGGGYVQSRYGRQNGEPGKG